MNDSMNDLDETLNEDVKSSRSNKLFLKLVDIVKNTADYKSINQIP